MLQQSRGLMALALGALAGPAAGQFVEIEPNDTKAQATVISGLVDGDRLSGALFPGDPADYYHLSTAPAPLGIYRHTMVDRLPRHLMDLRGLRQGPGPGLWGEIDLTSDLRLQAHVGSESVQWYGFGRGEQVVLSMDPHNFNLDYTIDFQTEEVTPTPLNPSHGGAFESGTIRIDGVFESFFGEVAASLRLHIFDDELRPIPGYTSTSHQLFVFFHDLERQFAPGTYYLAVGPRESTTSLPAPPDDEHGKRMPVLEFPDAYWPGPPGGITTAFELRIVDAAGETRTPIVFEPLPAYRTKWFIMHVGGGAPCDAPAITADPTATFVCVGNDALFTVGAAGTGPLSYQWRLDGVDIPGATSSDLIISPVDFGDAGDYDVVVTNACGSATSTAAFLQVSADGPDILAQPQDLELCPGEIASFSVATAPHHGGALSYQWHFNNTPIPGATGATYQFIVSGLSQDGVYSVEVCEQNCGCSDSFPAGLTVRNEAPAIALNGSTTLSLECGVDPYVEQGAEVTDDCDANVPLTIGGDHVNTHVPGLYTVTYDAVDSQGNAAETVKRYVSVVDLTAPAVDIAVTEQVLWSPNHELVNVGLMASIIDDCDPSAADNRIVRVYCDEVELPDTGDGTGRHSPDAKDMDITTLRLRSERQGRADGRVYLIMVAAYDASGNVGYDFTTVVCPHAQDQPALDLAALQANSIYATAQNAASTALGLQDVEQAIENAGFILHGYSEQNGRHQ